MIPIRAYIAAGVIAVLGLMYWRYDYVTTQNTKLKADLSTANSQLEQSQAIIAKERQNAAEMALRAQKFYEQEARDNEELEKLRACHADKSCWPRVRVKVACPSVSGAASSTGTPEEIAAELGEDSGRTALQLRAEIKETMRLVDALQKELIARSAPDYCKIKKPAY